MRKIKKRILYLCPEVPYPQETGGQVAFSNHIRVLSETFDVDAVMLNVDQKPRMVPVEIAENLSSVKVFPRKYRHVKGLKGFFSAIFLFFRFKYPRAFSVRINSEAQTYIESLSNNYDCLICDHFSSFALFKKKKAQIVYVAHNVEANVLFDQFRSEKNLIKRFFFYLEYLKTKRVEEEIFKRSNKIITLSLQDKLFLQNRYPTLVIDNISESLPVDPRLWEANSQKIITFMGGSNYFPNYDAIQWIVEELQPRLVNSNIIINIIGNCSSILRNNPDYINKSNLNFLGFVPDNKLDDILLKSSLFISPIIYGSGIKIKVLKALSLGIPILCTSESLFGLEYLSDLAYLIFNRKNPDKVKDQILELLDDNISLQNLSDILRTRTIQQAREMELMWEKIIA
ncbi:glycosyltransferase family 1 protein [Pedobacter sp. G11]|uniref:glycosyltransferase n=1 Tax=Pedobacter sp. G11 TaxID=2482728 RepID=UPI000F5FF53A|nr:glycosyltransferase [Pedobacter sp. G11]AZI25179.1 glycosyltransferase family 1 protein [Pedobacter sp. G11]